MKALGRMERVEEMDRLYLGIDVGSVSAKVVLMDSDKGIVRQYYTRTKGQPLKTVYEILSQELEKTPPSLIKGLAVTGSAGQLISQLLEAPFINEVVAHAMATAWMHPEARSIIEIGGKDSKLILLRSSHGQMEIEDFALNNICAAGTGSFLDQQASRLGMDIEAFGQLALKSTHPPRIAGRCSVFAKSDMIHLQQIATPDYDIVAGLCYAIARNFKSTVGKGRELPRPVCFQGGVAANLGVRKAFSDVLNLTNQEDLIIPKYFASMGAIGALLIAFKEGKTEVEFRGIERLEEHLRALRPLSFEQFLEPLSLSSERRQTHEKDHQVYSLKASEKGKPLYLGIDVGSISTNLVLIDEEGRVVARRYLMTGGRPLEAVRRGLEEIAEEVGPDVTIEGVATTGSGRYMIGEFVGADLVRNEIIAQATAAHALDPEVDTIFEIGGQDSKYVSLKDGAVVDFEMNKVCAAGTGSFLEEQAERLDISIKKEFGSLALSSPCPSPLGERCTVFMESDLLHYLQQGVKTPDLVAGLSYSIVQNYLNKVVGKKRIGERIFFQGGTAANLGIVAAFEKVLGKEISVPPHHDVTGAIGVALLAMRERNWAKSNFKGFSISKRAYNIETFECHDCPNCCEIKKVSIEGESPLFYGSRCEKYDVERKKRKAETAIPLDLFGERERLLLGLLEEKVDPQAPTIGIPRILFFHDFFPFFQAFFSELGLRLILSDKTNKSLIHQGVEGAVAETCFPIKVSLGHLYNLMEKGVKTIFLPSIIDLPLDKNCKDINTYVCPYAQAFPYVSNSAIDFESSGVKAIKPAIHFGRGRDLLEKELIGFAKSLGFSRGDAKKAMRKAEEAQQSFISTLKKRGEEVLRQLGDKKAVVILGRPYNSCDAGVNLDLPKKLREMGILPIPQDFLPIDELSPSSYEEGEEGVGMYWKSGRRILDAAHFIKAHSNLFPIYLTNFGCGPDSFISHFFMKALEGKPFLQLEIDEHSADAGVVTRLEAFWDSLKNVCERAKPMKKEALKPTSKPSRVKKIYLCQMSDHAFVLASALRAYGLQTEVMPMSDAESLSLGRKLTSGRECYPCILTTGDMAKVVSSPSFDKDSSVFFMPSGSGPCRFGQYHRFHRLVLDGLGYEEVSILSPNQDVGFYKDLGLMGDGFSRLAWRGIVACDLLEKGLRQTRPYQAMEGQAESLYYQYLQKICYEVEKGKEENLEKVLQEARKEFERLPLAMPRGQKVLIGIVGEIYVRCNRFSNNEIVRAVEELGGEVWMPPFGEWILYINYTSKRHALWQKDYGGYLKILLKDLTQRKEEHRLGKAFEPFLTNYPDPYIEDIIQLSLPYMEPTFEGEAILSVGKSIDFALKGACGIINTMPFTCMPGTIVSAISKRLREAHSSLPFLNLAYDGQTASADLLRLEAFIYQANQYKKKKEGH